MHRIVGTDKVQFGVSNLMIYKLEHTMRPSGSPFGKKSSARILSSRAASLRDDLGSTGAQPHRCSKEKDRSLWEKQARSDGQGCYG